MLQLMSQHLLWFLASENPAEGFCGKGVFPSNRTIKTFAHVQNKSVPVYCLNPISVVQNGCIISIVTHSDSLNFLATRLCLMLNKAGFI